MIINRFSRSKNAGTDEEADAAQTELVDEVTNILDTLQVNKLTLDKHQEIFKILGSQQSSEEGRICSQETHC